MEGPLNIYQAGSDDDRNQHVLSELALDIIDRMSRQPGIASLAMLVDCLDEVRDRLPLTFDEQIALLNALTHYLPIHLKANGTESLVDGLAQITSHLELCGELPCYPFETVFGQVQSMSEFEASRYLEGLDGLGRSTQWGGAERDLIALLNQSDEHSLPFEWSEQEWKDFDQLVQRSRARITQLLHGTIVALEAGTDVEPQAGTAIPTSLRYRNRPTGGRIAWKGTQVDLIYIIQLLKNVGLIDPATTDAVIINCFDYGSTAGNPVDVMRHTRARFRAGSTHTTPGLVERLRANLVEPVKAKLRLTGRKQQG